MSGEVFAACQHAVALKTGDDRQSECLDLLGIAAERPVADDRIVGVAVDIQDGREIHVHADGAQLQRRDLGETIGELHRSAAADRALPREDREPFRKPGHAPSLLVNRDEEGHPGSELLEAIR